MRRPNAATLSTLALCATAPALAVDIDAASRIDAVTLYRDVAVVTRTAEVDVPLGASRLVFHALPGAIYAVSLRVSGEGDRKILLGAIETNKPASLPATALWKHGSKTSRRNATPRRSGSTRSTPNRR